MMRICRWFELYCALIPIRIMLKLWRFWDEFANTVAMPIIALFLGPGTPATLHGSAETTFLD
jgi:hypothetical protein